MFCLSGISDNRSAGAAKGNDMKIYVDASAAENGDGSRCFPYRTISEAAKSASPGDEVIVAPGIYREYVDPARGGNENARIVYRSAEKGKAHITGSEPAGSWIRTEGNVWMTRISNSMFGDYNPFTTLISGDWFMAQKAPSHTGTVYLNDKSMYEVFSYEDVAEPPASPLSWDPEFSGYVWYAEQDPEKDETVLYANFQDRDPDKENIEISVRRACFFPSKEGCGYITLSGFTVSKAATQWAPPTAFQEGMIGPHWSKGWIIEDCEIFESKCSGISLGKYLQPDNDNKWLKWKYKDGTQTERECICRAVNEGWDREHIGSHIIRRCDIHDCGQTGIVGHLGGVFSLIEDNHIHHINNKQDLAGAEIGGIKLHAAIDTVIRRNHIHNCIRGIWLDWQAQGTRVSSNLLHDNALPVDFEPEMVLDTMGEDLFVEVSHGPTLIDNNILLSDRALKLCTQGVAVVHNLIAGSLTGIGIGTDNGAPDIPSPRYTPYHVPHSTKIAGFMTILHGDMRFFNNIFVQKEIRPGMKTLSELAKTSNSAWDECNIKAGTFCFNGYPDRQEWERQFDGYCGMGSRPSNRYYDHLPVYCEGNAYFNGAEAWEKETGAMVDRDHIVSITLDLSSDEPVIGTDAEKYLKPSAAGIITTEKMGAAFEPEQRFENPDGTDIALDRDYFGNLRCGPVYPGPFADCPDIIQ